MKNRIEVFFDAWTPVLGKYTELKRRYDFKNLGGPETSTSIEVTCRLIVDKEAGSANRAVRPFIYLVIDPCILEQTEYVAAQFAPSDDLINWKILTAKVEAAASGINFVVFDISDGDHLLSLLMLGKQLTLRLFSESGETLASIPFENDNSFREAFEQLKFLRP